MLQVNVAFIKDALILILITFTVENIYICKLSAYFLNKI